MELSLGVNPFPGTLPFSPVLLPASASFSRIGCIPAVDNPKRPTLPLWIQGSATTIVASLAVQAGKASSFSFKAKESLVSHLPSEDFVQTLSNPIKKLTLKAATYFFFLSPGILTLISPQGFSNNSSNKVIACYLKQGGPGFQERLTQVLPVQNGEPLGHNRLLLVLSTWLGSAEWS